MKRRNFLKRIPLAAIAPIPVVKALGKEKKLPEFYQSSTDRKEEILQDLHAGIIAERESLARDREMLKTIPMFKYKSTDGNTWKVETEYHILDNNLLGCPISVTTVKEKLVSRE